MTSPVLDPGCWSGGGMNPQPPTWQTGALPRSANYNGCFGKHGWIKMDALK